MAGNSSAGNATKRLYILGAILCFWLIVVALRLVQLEIFQYGQFERRAMKQQQRTTDISPSRGVIYDRNGHELAMSITGNSVFSVPSEVPDRNTTASLIARILKADPKDIASKFDCPRNVCPVARKIDPELGARIASMNLRGIYVQPEPKRYYPKGELASQILGYVGVDDEGLAGIEHAYDSELKGKKGTVLISMDARKRRFDSVEKQPEPGDNLVLTVDEKIQYIVERELEKAMEDTHAEAGTVVVQNPHTGEILALASRPTFNPNLSRKINPAELKNRAVSDVYEPGSVFKVVTYSAALEEGIEHPDDLIDCQGGMIVVNGLRIHDLHKMGTVSIAEALAKSSDVAAVKVGLKLGDERLYKYIRAYGFGSQTGIELPGETRGLAKPVNKWSKVSIGAMSIGQEVGVTPLQLVSMVSTIANDGVYLPPRILAGTTKPSNGPQTIAFHPANGHRVVSTMTAAQMKKMMEGVVLFGTAKRAILDGYSSAGKTGTAQKIDPATHRYSSTKYVASFAGFAPVNNPAITIVVSLDSPIGLHQGGQVSAPVFQRVATQVLAYLHVQHDVEVKDPKRLLLQAKAKDEDLNDSSPDHPGEPLDFDEEAKADAPVPSVAKAEPAHSGAVKPASQSTTSLPDTNTLADASAGPASPGGALPPNGTVILDVSDGAVVPSFLGKSMRSVIEAAQTAGIEVDAFGSGVAREQSPAPGSRLPAGRRVAVRFGR